MSQESKRGDHPVTYFSRDDLYLYLGIIALLLAAFVRYDSARGLYLTMLPVSVPQGGNMTFAVVRNMYDTNITLYKLSSLCRETNSRNMTYIKVLAPNETLKVKAEIGSVFLAGDDEDPLQKQQSETPIVLPESQLSAISHSKKAEVKQFISSYYLYPLQRVPVPRTIEVEYGVNVRAETQPDRVINMNTKQPSLINAKFR
jgi:hypothetical protein